MAEIVGTPGHDFIHVAGDGRTPPAGSNEMADATINADTIQGGGGDDTVFAGPGDDLAVYSGSLDDYAVALMADGHITVRDNRAGRPDGDDVLFDVETLQFADGARINIFGPVVQIIGSLGADSFVVRNAGLQNVAVDINGGSINGGGTIVLNGDLVSLDINGIDGNDTISARGDLSDTPLAEQWPIYTVGESTTRFTSPTMFFRGGGGDDVIDLSGAILSGQPRPMFPGQQYDAEIDLGAGDDTFIGNSGLIARVRNSLVGGSTPGADTVDSGGAPGNIVTFSTLGILFGTPGVTVDLAAGVATMPGIGLAMSLANVTKVRGSSGHDHFTGNSSANLFEVGAGDDTIIGGGQEPWRYDVGGGTTVSTVVDLAARTATATGSDITYSGLEGWDGSSQADTLLGTSGANKFRPGGGNDLVDGRRGTDIVMLQGEDQDYDIALVPGGATTITDTRAVEDPPPGQRHDGVDTLTGIELIGFGNVLKPLDPNRAFQAGIHVDDLRTGDMPPAVEGSARTDRLTVEGGDQPLYLTNDRLILNFYFFVGFIPETEALAHGEPDLAVDGVEYITLRGDGGITVAGDLSGGDLLAAGLLLQGGAEADTLDASGVVSQHHIRLLGLAGADALHGGAGRDTLEGGGGNDTLTGGGGKDSMAGGTGNDTYVIDTVHDSVLEAAGEGVDTVHSPVSRTLVANIENLVLLGNAGLTGNGNTLANLITGNAGANLLQGRDGNDTLAGGLGNDTLVGGSHADVFRFAAVNAGADRITDFQKTVDRFQLSGGSFTSLTIAANGDSILTHAGGTVRVAGAGTLSLAQWNALVIPGGVDSGDDTSPGLPVVGAGFNDAFGFAPLYQNHAARFAHGDWLHP